MCMRFALAVVLGLSSSPSPLLSAEEPPTDPGSASASPDQSPADPAALAHVVKENTENIAALTQQHQLIADRVATNSQQIEQLGQGQQVITDQLLDVNTQLEQIRADQQVISDQIRELNVQLEQISRTSSGGRVLRFDNIQESTARDQFRRLVDDTTPETGTLVVTNKMEKGQYLMVNRREYYFRPGETRRLAVNVGNVSTRLPGQRTVNWTIARPTYEQRLEISPELAARTLGSSTVYYSRPIYNADPVYVGYASGFYW